MKKIGALAAVLAAQIILPSSVEAQNWSAPLVDAQKALWAVDLTSIKPNGAFIESWVLVTQPRDLWDASGHKHYRMAKIRRVDDCNHATSASVAAVMMDSGGRTTSSFNAPENNWQFDPVPPGSLSAMLQQKICSEASRRAALNRTLDVAPSASGEWQPVGGDQANGSQFSFAPKSVHKVSASLIGYFSKTVNNVPIKLPDGNDYRTSVTLVLIDCDRSMFSTVAADLYNDNDILVQTIKLDNAAWKFDPISAGSVLQATQRQVCGLAKSGGTGQSEQTQTDQSGIVTGTAWMAPKGYLVTASHVVHGALRVGLAQNGQMVGTAEIVTEDPANDVAILRPHLPPGFHTAIRLSDGRARLGESVFTLGYPAPDTLGLSLKETSGEVSAMAGDDVASHRLDDVRLLQISVPIQSGNSGGPVIDGNGGVVGIVISKMQMATDTEIAQNVNYSLKIGYVKTIIDELPDLGNYRLGPNLASRTALIESLKDSIFLVIATKPASK